MRRVSCERAAAVSVIAPVDLGVPQNRQGQYWLSRHLQRLDCRYLLALEVFHHIELIRGLQVQPKLRCCAEVAGKARSCIGCDSSLAVHDLIDAPGRHADCHRHLILGNPKPFNKVFQQDFSGMNWRNFVSDSQRSLPPQVLNRST